MLPSNHLAYVTELMPFDQSMGGSGYAYLVPYAVAFISLENITALYLFRSEPGWERVRVPGALCRGLHQPGKHNSTVSL
jgi:hypothetical protein